MTMIREGKDHCRHDLLRKSASSLRNRENANLEENALECILLGSVVSMRRWENAKEEVIVLNFIEEMVIETRETVHSGKEGIADSVMKIVSTNMTLTRKVSQETRGLRKLKRMDLSKPTMWKIVLKKGWMRELNLRRLFLAKGLEGIANIV